jgi:predicted PhzF superfamily epimerase YddE/YHI9
VFTNKRYIGNLPAILFTGGNLGTVHYENIASEFGYSETSFIYSPGEQKVLNVRRFTPAGFEVHGAGYNLLGVICATLPNGMKIFKE